jgi:murein DD-endopeptidase MepM/ murein hydrolase activator NlpD
MEKGRFTKMLIEENALHQSGFERWIFYPGMLFNSPDKWWGDLGRRDFPHEGIDLCLYKDRSGKMHRLDIDTRIPVMHDGMVKAIFKDYLGQALIVEHENPGSNTGKFISFYAHTKPSSTVGVGTVVTEGDIIATLADTANSKSKILPHLHFSLGIPSESFSFKAFAWNSLRNPAMITLLDPLPVINWPYEMLDGEFPA